MQYWIGVIGTSLTYDRFGNEEANWFCLPRTSEVGDKLILYATKKISKSNNGLFASYKIVNKDSSKDAMCKKYGITQGTLVHVDMKKESEFKRRVTLEILRGDEFFAVSQFVRRNAQATYFNITEDQYKRILTLSKS